MQHHLVASLDPYRVNSQRLSKSVLDLAPWPNGLGFKGAESWWVYVLGQPERDRINFLMAAALLSEEVTILLLKHDRDLFERFEFTEQTIIVLSEIEANTLAEFSLTAMLKLSLSE